MTKMKLCPLNLTYKIQKAMDILIVDQDTGVPHWNWDYEDIYSAMTVECPTVEVVDVTAAGFHSKIEMDLEDSIKQEVPFEASKWLGLLLTHLSENYTITKNERKHDVK